MSTATPTPAAKNSEHPTAGALVVVGAINVDLVVAADRLPGPGETVVGAGPHHSGGGKGANAAVAAARAGAHVVLIGAVGDDATGTVALDELAAEGIDLAGVARLDGVATGVALIVVDGAGENQIAVGAGANGLLSAGHVRTRLHAWLDEVRGPGCVLVSTEIPDDAISAAVETATDAGVACVLNPAPVTPAVARLAGRGPILTPNRSEGRDLARQMLPGAGASSAPGDQARDPIELAGLLCGYSDAPVVMTLGAQGAVLVQPGLGVERIPAPSLPPGLVVLDTTGAGDTFNGVLAARLAGGVPIGEAAREAVLAASLSVSAIGARAGMPTADAIAAARASVLPRNGSAAAP
jgi:ribokinase